MNILNRFYDEETSEKQEGFAKHGHIRRKAKMNERIYEKAFLRMNEMQKRGSKSIYLSAENHERLTRIVQIVGEDKIPLFAYLNNILEHHFKVFEQTITKEFKEKYKRLF